MVGIYAFILCWFTFLSTEWCHGWSVFARVRFDKCELFVRFAYLVVENDKIRLLCFIIYALISCLSL